MKIILIALMLLLTVSIFAVQQDAILHFLCSAGAYKVPCDLLETTELSISKCEGYSFWIAFSIGLGKETYDEFYGTGFSADDMFYNMVGIVTSLGFNRLVRKLEYRRMTLMLNRNRIRAEWKF